MAVVIDGVEYLEGDGTWPWLRPAVEGSDLVVRGTTGSYFTDNQTASGISADTPEILGCALPFNYGPCKGSPIPNIKWETDVYVRVFCPATNKEVTVLRIDLGPAKRLQRGIDLTIAAVEALGLTTDQGVYELDYRIFNAAPTL